MAARNPNRRESVIERLQRLADTARAEGVRIVPTGTAIDLVDDYVYAENPSHGTWYVVSIAEGCTCPGYHHAGCCKHLAALMTAAGVVKPSAAALAWHAEQAERASAEYAEQLAALDTAAAS